MATTQLNAVSIIEKDFDTVYDLADGAVDLDVQVSRFASVSVSLVADSLAGTLDGTVEIQGSESGLTDEYQNLNGGSTIDLTADGLYGWTKDLFNPQHLRLKVTPVGITGGTLKAIVTIKTK